jgi:ketosteroid isomerase-like protein
MSRDDLEVVKAIYERWQRGDLAAELLDPEIDWSTPHPDAAALHGRQEVVAFLRRYAGTFEDYRMELEELRDLGDHRVLARFSESGRGKGSGVETHLRASGEWTIRDGRAIAFRADTDRPANPGP